MNNTKSKKLRTPISFQFQVVDANGTVVMTEPGPVVDFNNLSSLRSYTRAVSATVTVHELLQEVLVLFGAPSSRQKQADLLQRIAAVLAAIHGKDGPLPNVNGKAGLS